MQVISRHLNILDYSISHLLRNKLKTFGLFFLFSLILFFLSSFQLTSSALREYSSSLLKGVPDITVQQMSAGRQISLTGEPDEALKNIYGIKRVRKRIWGYYFDEKNGANYTVIGLRKEHISEQMKDTLLSGDFPSANGEVLISPTIASNMQLGQRKKFSLFRPDLSMKSFSTSGLFKNETGIITGDLMVMSFKDAADLFALKEGEYTDLLVDAGNPREINTISRKLSDAFPGSRVITKEQIQKTYDAVFSYRSGIGLVFLMTSLLAFIILAWDKATGLTPEEKREMAILKIVGWQTRDIMVMRFWESALICTFSFFLGYGCGWLHCLYFDSFLIKSLMLGWSVLPSSYDLVPPFLLSDFFLISGCCYIPYLMATIVPAWKSGIVKTDTAI